MRYWSILTLFIPFLSQALNVQLLTTNESCGHQNGMVMAQPSGGMPPYTYEWSTGSTADQITGLSEGWYSVTVTDGVGTTASAQSLVLNAELDVTSGGWTPTGGAPCMDECNGGFSVPLEMINGQQPYSLAVSAGYVADASYPHPLFMGVCDMEPVTLTVTDATGCSGQITVTIDGPEGFPIEITNVNGTCGGQANGSVLIILPPDGNSWDPGYHVVVYNQNLGNISSGYTQGLSETQEWLLEDLPADVYTLHQIFYTGNQDCTRDYFFTIPNLGNDCATVSGDLWYGAIIDCVEAPYEVAIPYSVLEIQPGPQYAITNGSGHYSRNLPYGSYTLAQTDATLIAICPVIQPVPFVLNTSVEIDMEDGSTTPLDLSISASQSPARPGFVTSIWGQVVNATPQVSGPVTVTCVLASELEFLGAEPMPTNVSGNTITWELAAFGSFGGINFNVTAQVPVSVPLGATLTTELTTANTLTESNLANNVTTLNVITMGSYDPNMKEVLTSTRQSPTAYFIGQDQWLDYTIHFQNTGTAAAIDVVVTDTISEDLDLSSFQQGVASHAFDVRFLPERVVEWRFTDIQLPSSEVDEAASHGAVSFRIRPVQPVLPGTTYRNAADIFFDFNPPIRTDDAVVVAEMSTRIAEQDQGQIMLFPNPANDRVTLNAGEEVIRTYAIHSADGRLVRSGRVGRAGVTLDIADLATGPYTVRLVLERGGLTTAHFIKLLP